MIVFRHAARLTGTIALLRRIEKAHTCVELPEGGLRLLLAVAAWEAAVADYHATQHDADDPPCAAARRLLLLAGHAFLGHAAAGANWAAAWGAVVACRPPAGASLRVAPPEGFCFYGLHPNRYVEAAGQWARRHPPEAGRPAVVIGLRTIGSALAAVVAATLVSRGHAVRLLTLRPRGAPADRHCAAAPALEADLRRGSARFLVVDEGPGLSGSSFGGAVEWLRRLAVPEAHISLFPSWDPPAERPA